jgi:hypothetical protein
MDLESIEAIIRWLGGILAHTNPLADREGGCISDPSRENAWQISANAGALKFQPTSGEIIALKEAVLAWKG